MNLKENHWKNKLKTYFYFMNDNELYIKWCHYAAIFALFRKYVALKLLYYPKLRVKSERLIWQQRFCLWFFSLNFSIYLIFSRTCSFSINRSCVSYINTRPYYICNSSRWTKSKAYDTCDALMTLSFTVNVHTLKHLLLFTYFLWRYLLGKLFWLH